MASVYGSNASETLNLLDGVSIHSDTIWDFGGDDTIFALGGDDWIYAGSGADTIDGGTGFDRVNYRDSNSGVTVSLLSGTGSGGYAEGDTLISIENLTGSFFADFLIGNDGNNVLAGLWGDDILKGGGGADTLFGDDGNDTLKGGGGADTLDGGSGIDTANYAESDEAVFVSLIHDAAGGGDAEGDELNQIENVSGSAYNDNLWGSDGANTLWGNNGNDTLKGYGGNDALYGGNGNDTLLGMDGVDTLRGESGNDMMDGGAGIDTMIGGVGDDTYYVNSASDIVTELGGQGNDIVYSTAYNYVLSDAASVEVLSLDTATDTGVYITGNSQHNTVFGNVNDNVLDGGGANDILSGLGGNDIFVFRAGEAHGDVVYEFEGNGAGLGDQLQFVGYGPGATFTQASATEWIIASADASISEVITFVGGPAIDPTDYVFV